MQPMAAITVAILTGLRKSLAIQTVDLSESSGEVSSTRNAVTFPLEP